MLVKQAMSDGSAVGGNVVEPELFCFVVDCEMIYWSAKGCFGVSKVPIEELGVRVGDKSCFIISTGKDILLKRCKIVAKWEAVSQRGDQVRVITTKFNMGFGS